MGLILDIVPNHMGVGHGNNPWWQDVLQNGRTSIYADFFDIDWNPLKPELRNKVLLPILGQPYGDDLEAGNIKISFEEASFLVKYFDKILPVDPQTIPSIFAPSAHRTENDLPAAPPFVELRSILNSLSKLPGNFASEPDEVRRRQEGMPNLVAQLQRLTSESGEVRTYIENVLLTLNGTVGDSSTLRRTA